MSPNFRHDLVITHRVSIVLATNRLQVPGEPVPNEVPWAPGLPAAHQLMH